MEGLLTTKNTVSGVVVTESHKYPSLLHIPVNQIKISFIPIGRTAYFGTLKNVNNAIEFLKSEHLYFIFPGLASVTF
jgi:hypothetical protein